MGRFAGPLALCFVILGILGQPRIAPAQEADAPRAAPDTAEAEELGIFIGHGDKGFEFGTRDGNFLLQVDFRFQFRYAYPRDESPVTFDEFRGEPDQHILKVNRARFKVGGHAYRPWLKWYMEYELQAGNLLDFRFMVERYSLVRLKVGQWKVQYNRERIISSGKQQLVDRSIITRPFTVDRQQGVSLYGRLKGGGIADFNYWASVFTGTGRGAKENDDDQLMWMARGQWNFLGRELAFSGSDIPYHEKGAGLLALAAVTNQSPYTRFSQAGGGELEGFEPGGPGQYRVNQWMEETAFKYRGFAWQQEFHWKRIEDNVNITTTTLIGAYFQAGYFFHYAWSAIPKPLEIAARYAFYEPNVDQPGDLQEEFSLDANWFLGGHRNKLTAEVTYLEFHDPARGEESGVRWRLQWDISI